jgi:quercetin dioxygenase-like cupin family protein
MLTNWSHIPHRGEKSQASTLGDRSGAAALRRAVYAMAATGALGLAACDGPARVTRPDAPPRGDKPEFTLASGVTTTQLGSANAGVIRVQSLFNHYEVDLRARENTDVRMSTSVIAPGGNTGWHGHPGLVIVLIKSGALTFYEANDPHCQPTVHPAGTVVFETSGDVHIARNEGTVNAEFTAMQLLAAGATPRIDVPAPGNCPF